MNRRQFATLGTAFALSAPSLVTAQQANSVIVIGAGAAGLTAAYHLRGYGVDVTVLEASNRWGGRVKRLDGFADVPLDLGAEWIHGEPSLLGQILDQGDTNPGVATIRYNPQTYQFWHREKLKDLNIASSFYEEVKFKDTTWYGFFEKYMIGRLRSDIKFNSQVVGIDSGAAGVTVRTKSGQTYSADRVIVTVPISILQDSDIAFSSPKAKRLRSLNDVAFGSGYKIFMLFKERFYPDILVFGSRRQALSDSYDSKLYYDAAFNKPTNANILGLFNVDHDNLPRTELGDKEMINGAMAELADIYGPDIRTNLIKAKVQNWSREPFIRGSYSMTNNSNAYLRDILAPIDGKIFFAGEALGGNDQSTVHGAAFSALEAVEAIFA